MPTRGVSLTIALRLDRKIIERDTVHQLLTMLPRAVNLTFFSSTGFAIDKCACVIFNYRNAGWIGASLPANATFEKIAMKIAFAVAAIVGLAATGSAFAQTASSGTVSGSAAYQQSSQQVTRAQVYADLVHAQKDGQIRRLNRLYYGKP